MLILGLHTIDLSLSYAHTVVYELSCVNISCIYSSAIVARAMHGDPELYDSPPQLPVLAKSLGKRVFKRHLEGFLDSIFYGLVSGGVTPLCL